MWAQNPAPTASYSQEALRWPEHQQQKVLLAAPVGGERVRRGGRGGAMARGRAPLLGPLAVLAAVWLAAGGPGAAAGRAGRALHVGGGSGGLAAGGRRSLQQDKKAWTILLYLHADNDLEYFSYGDMVEMAELDISRANLIVQYDRTGHPEHAIPMDHAIEIRDGEGTVAPSEWTGTKLLKFQGKNPTTGKGRWLQLYPAKVSDTWEVNMDDSATLADFLGSLADHPADKYMAALWNHGMGWPGFGGDYDTGVWSSMNQRAMVQGIKAGLEQSQGKGGPAKLDILGFDACLQASFGVIATVAEFAHYIVASEDLAPGHGWDYRGLKPENAGAEEFGKALIDQFMAFQVSDWETGKMEHQNPKTQVLVKTAVWQDEFMPKVNKLFAKLSEGLQARMNYVLGTHRSAVTRSSALKGAFGTQDGEHANIDLGHYLTNLAEIATGQGPPGTPPVCDELKALALDAKAAYEAAKAYQRDYGIGMESKQMTYTGVHVYLPKAKVLRKTGTAPDYSDVADGVFWKEWLDLSALYEAQLAPLTGLIRDNLKQGSYATDQSKEVRDKFCKNAAPLPAEDIKPVAPEEPAPALYTFTLGDPTLTVGTLTETGSPIKYLDVEVPGATLAIEGHLYASALIPADEAAGFPAEYELLVSATMDVGVHTLSAQWDTRIYYLDQKSQGAADPRNVAPLNAFYVPGGEGALDGGDVFFSPVFATVTTFLNEAGTARAAEMFKIPVLLYQDGHDMSGMVEPFDLARHKALLDAGKPGELVGRLDFATMKTTWTLYGDVSASQGVPNAVVEIPLARPLIVAPLRISTDEEGVNMFEELGQNYFFWGGKDAQGAPNHFKLTTEYLDPELDGWYAKVDLSAYGYDMFEQEAFVYRQWTPAEWAAFFGAPNAASAVAPAAGPPLSAPPPPPPVPSPPAAPSAKAKPKAEDSGAARGGALLAALGAAAALLVL